MGSQETRDSYHLPREPIAIVGSSCRFPGGATSPSKLWNLLETPKDVLQEIPESRFSTKAFYHRDGQHHGSTNVKHAYLLHEDPRAFDRDFFSITPKEAEAMDPQQRVLLETVYEGVESAGYSMQNLRGSRTAIFVGCMSYDYHFIAIRGIESLPQYHSTGTAASILANRVSYFFDWRGPSVTIDTACSSSLVALHQAVSALRNGEVEMAVAAGSNLILGPEPFVSESKLNMLSPNGRSFMWDASADGYTRGEGCCAIFLKTLSKAIADGDHIESIVRETGVNSDGKTPGITMPSSESQAQLIRDTYARCGLDLTRESDRPQYFEAHGTGTQAGDPIEARAIQSVFFPDGQVGQLMVGSVKTIIGHTEGTAGVAGVLKASLAVQHGQIPANLHFKNLNPKIKPYYTNLQIPLSLTPWPSVSQGAPRRVSVNSFGFGGTNAHAIIESWDDYRPSMNDHALVGQAPIGDSATDSSRSHNSGPLLLSANSGQALTSSTNAMLSYLREHPDTNLDQLRYTLSKRTEFPLRAAFSATSIEQLVEKLEASKDSLRNVSRARAIPEAFPLRILGVFTGQGAQWPSMGKELYGTSSVFRSAIDEMQRTLELLPAEDRPDWSLADQLNAAPASSRAGDAAVSQPLCTALQIALVDTLEATGIKFDAVVGHSSGEIGAAYAAGYLTASDAIRIAYYRGLHSHLAHGPGGKRGKMMAVSMSFSQAKEFCIEFGETLVVAASNSQTSCTIAGDAEAIDEAHARLQQSGTFARVLQVDTAYHSHHMKACIKPYLNSMRECGIVPQDGHKHCRWYSSVWGDNGRSRSFDQEDGLLLKDQYWGDNMAQTVLFSQALTRALHEDQCLDLVLEIGPHPALKGPCLETIKLLTGFSIPYSGVLKRGQNAVESFADALGFLWTSFDLQRPIITFDGFSRAFPSGKPQKLDLLKDLPSYPWDHRALVWKESRSSRIFRTRKHSRHELLGQSTTYGERDKREVHWRQLIKLSELPWLAGHRVQGEILLAAAGYLSLAYEAIIRLVDDQEQLRLVELYDLDIVRAMRLQEDSSGLEVFFTVRVSAQTDDYIAADLSCYTGAVDAVQPLGDSQAGMAAHFTGRARLWLGRPMMGVLPTRKQPVLPMESLDMAHLYSNLSKEGINYSEYFQAKAMRRRLNSAVVTLSSPPKFTHMRTAVHPAPLDTAFHGLFAGFSFPGDGRIGSIYLPTRVDCVRISMMQSESHEPVLKADATVISTDNNIIVGDLDIFDAENSQIEVQLRGVRLTPVGQRRDRWLYASPTWIRDADFGIPHGQAVKISDGELVLYEQLTRTAYFYLRRLHKLILPQELLIMSKYRKHMMTWVVDHLFPQIEAGEHPEIRPEWIYDTLEMVQEWRASQPSDNNDMNILHAMGKNLVSIVRGITQPLKVLMQDSLLDRLYVEGIGFKHGNADLATLMKQLTHRYPRMRMLEVGAGTGGTTRAVLDAIGNHYTSFTYTDISTGFFENARTIFSQHSSKLNFKTLNIENSPKDQGFAAGSYDVVISSNCLHATRRLGETLRNCRQLLRPGGKLVLLEITRDFLPLQLIMSTLSGWFFGIEDGRVWSPTVDLGRWDELLRANGFSGIDVSSTPSFASVIMAEAVDEVAQLIREPLYLKSEAPSAIGDIIVLGGGIITKFACQVQAVLQATVPPKTVTIQPGLEDIQVPKGAAVLSLCDLDCPVFRGMDDKRFQGLRNVMETADVVLWVSSSAQSDENPDANTTLGLSSTLQAERMDLKLQFLDIDDPSVLKPSILAEMLLRIAFSDLPEAQNMLWTHEPELALRDGALYFPRVLPLDTVNNRSAARLRQVTQATDLGSKDTTVVLDKHQDTLRLLAAAMHEPNEDEARIQVTASTGHAMIYGSSDPIYLCIGRDQTKGDKVLAISRVNSSLINIPGRDILYRWHQDKIIEDDSAELHSLLTHAIADCILDGLMGCIWIHEVPADLNDAIRTVAFEKDITLFQTTSHMPVQPGTVYCHPFASEDNLQCIRPTDVGAFLDFGRLPNKTLSTMLQHILIKSTISQNHSERIHLKCSSGELRSLAKRHFDSDGLLRTRHFEPVAIDKLSKLKVTDLGLSAIFDWSTAQAVSAIVSPLEHRGLFAPNKTYLLCGMTGDLGISVCLWMIENGARNVVLTSRNPKVAPGVLEHMSRKGATVRPMAVDIANMDSLRAAYSDIKSKMPPMGGVMNAAMVLRDRFFHHMSWDDFAAVLAPKMVGSKNLDDIFGTESLDFFICFSSTTSIVGSIGQSAYATANHYMARLIKSRLQRGLAGSVIHISILTGFGYIFRRDAEHADTIHKAILPRMERQSETDLHEMIAEAIVCGRPNSGQPSELITGIRTVFQGEWREDPRLSCYIGQQPQQDDSGRQQASNAISVKDQLAGADAPTECLPILVKCFLIALGNMLEIDPAHVNSNAPIARLGIDSLVAIRIREWFLKEMGVDVPVLKVMSDTYSTTRMCDDALVAWRRLSKASK